MTTTPDLLRLGPPVTLALQTAPGVCSCAAGATCARPGGHPLPDRWWTTSPVRHDETGDTDPGARRTAATDGANHAVLLPPGTAVLQVPAAQRTLLLRHLAGNLLTPPIVHTPRRCWVWTHAPQLRPTRIHPSLLPDPDALHLLRPGAWVPVPPAPVPPEHDIWWGGRPTADPLTPAELADLHNRLVIAHRFQGPTYRSTLAEPT